MSEVRELGRGLAGKIDPVGHGDRLIKRVLSDQTDWSLNDCHATLSVI